LRLEQGLILGGLVLANTNTEENRRIEYIDVLRVLSMLAVVFLHTAAGSLRSGFNSALWHFSNILTAFLSVSVPVFFMISGAMLLGGSKPLTVGSVYRRRLPKVFLPFLLWSLLAVLYYALRDLFFLGGMDSGMLAEKLVYMPTRPVMVHLWFMYVLIPIYILLPILKKLADFMDKKILRYLLAVWLVFSVVLPTVKSVIPEGYQSILEAGQTFSLDFLGGYLGYFFLGHYLHKYKVRVSKKFLVLIILIDTLFVSFATWYATINEGAYTEVFKKYTGLCTVVLASAVFLLVKKLFTGIQMPRKVYEVLQFLSRLSFGVYLLHNIVIDLLGNWVSLWPARSAGILLLSYITVVFVSLACIIILASFKYTCFALTGLTYRQASETCNLRYIARKIFPGGQRENDRRSG